LAAVLDSALGAQHRRAARDDGPSADANCLTELKTLLGSAGARFADDPPRTRACDCPPIHGGGVERWKVKV
jgi:hypothetical protein